MTSRAERHREPETPRPKRTSGEILLSVSETLRMAVMGLADLQSDDHERRLPGLRNVCVDGHATTQTLQNLRSVDDDFDGWYEPIREALKADPLMRFFWDLRTDILKKGDLTGLAQERTFSNPAGSGILTNAPTGAVGFALPDETGRPGWLVEDADGTQRVVRTDWNAGTSVAHRFEFVNAPTTHRGRELSDRTVVALATLYVDYLRDLADQARARFSDEAPAQQPPPPAP